MIVQIRALDGSIVEFEESKIIGKGEMKDVYFSPDKSYVVAFYRNKKLNKEKLIDRLDTIVTKYRNSIFNNKGGAYWEPLYCWPTKVVIYNDQIGLVSPTYRSCFFFKYGSENNDSGGIKGKEKEGKWFSSIRNQKYLDPRERGNFKGYMIACMRLAQAVKRLNAAGLAHSDLSYKNVLIDPPTGQISIIDLDGLVVTGKFNPEVMGTSDFIAPEVMETQHLELKDPKRILPSIETDCHALATLIYMYLLNRHPLKGSKVYDLDPDVDDELVMGEDALFIEHPTDHTNCVNPEDLHPLERESGDPKITPYTICGPYLKVLFERAFIDGLHNPRLRPRAEEWATALIRTYEILVPCFNSRCDHGWFVYDKGVRSCPFCHHEVPLSLPIFIFYRSVDNSSYSVTNHRFVAYDKRDLSMWLLSNEQKHHEFVTDEERKTVANITYENGNWYINNISIEGLSDVTAGFEKPIRFEESFRLIHGSRLKIKNFPDQCLYVLLDHSAEPPENLSFDATFSGYNYISNDARNERPRDEISRFKQEYPTFYNKYHYLFDRDEIIFPNGVVNREYNFDFSQIFPKECSIYFAGLDSLGLYYSPETKSIKGYPSQIGDISIVITFKLDFAPIKVNKIAKLTVLVSEDTVETIDDNSKKLDMTSLPKASLDTNYRVNLLPLFKDIEVEDISGISELGLCYNRSNHTVTGKPTKIGCFVLKIRYHSKGLASSKNLMLSRSVMLQIDPPIVIKWDNIPTPTNIKFYKPDDFCFHKQVYVNDSLTSQKQIYAVSMRGKLHANNGHSRNADCAYGNKNGWVVLAMADGSNKAEYSREGARLAVNFAIESYIKTIESNYEQLEDIVYKYAHVDNQGNNKRSTQNFFENLAGNVFKTAFNEIVIQSNFASIHHDEMATNLSTVLMKRYDFGYFVFTASIGKFGLALCDANYDLIPFGFSDKGDYIFRDGLITEQAYFENNEFKKRIDFKICDSIIMLICMNYELCREIFGGIVNMRNKDLWTNFVAEFASQVDLREKDPESIISQMKKYVGSISHKMTGDETLIIVK